MTKNSLSSVWLWSDFLWRWYTLSDSLTSQRTETRAFPGIRTGAVKPTLQLPLYVISGLKDSSRGQGTGHVQTFRGDVPAKHNAVLPSHYCSAFPGTQKLENYLTPLWMVSHEGQNAAGAEIAECSYHRTVWCLHSLNILLHELFAHG